MRDPFVSPQRKSVTMIRKPALLLAAAAVFGLAAFNAPLTVPVEPPAGDIVFDVYRNGSEFGVHRVRFEDRGEGEFLVDVNIEFDVQLGPINLFRYRHQSSEVWSDGELEAVAGATLKDGEWTRFTHENGSADAALLALPPSSHWRGYAPETGLVLSTETGEPMAVEVVDLGPDTVQTANGPVEARRLRITGTLSMDLWYDDEGRWVGCEFEARGHSIRYVLRDNGAGDLPRAS